MSAKQNAFEGTRVCETLWRQRLVRDARGRFGSYRNPDDWEPEDRDFVLRICEAATGRVVRRIAGAHTPE